MNLAQKFETKEDLIKTLDEHILQDENGSFYLSDLKERNDRLAQEVEQSRKYRLRAQEAESRLRDQELEVSRLNATVEELNQLNPLDLQEKVKTYTLEKGTLTAEKERLAAENENLRQELDTCLDRENSRAIHDALLEAAERFGIRPEAVRDVLRLAPELHVLEDGSIQTENGLTVEQLVLHEKELSPHWIPVSIPGGSASTGNLRPLDNRYAQACLAGDLTAMILNAPIVE